MWRYGKYIISYVNNYGPFINFVEIVLNCNNDRNLNEYFIHSDNTIAVCLVLSEISLFKPA